jgi:Zn-dependent protease with chaperone function
MTSSATALPDYEKRRRDLLAGFEGAIEPVPTTLGYRVALAVVAVAMVLLPLVYLSLIAGIACGMYGHGVYNTTILAGPKMPVVVVGVHAGAYVAPLFFGALAIVWLLKPFVAPRRKRPASRPLDPQEEPLLFEFVARVCAAVGAPPPREIRLDLAANASAGFRRGLRSFLSHDLVLTLGVPLVAGLELRELATVIAHEFGHFTQHGAMRFWYVIHSVNLWFARVVYERDAWDERIAELWEDGYHGRTVKAMAALIWLGRRVLHVLMVAGHAISCALSRHMEYDADRHAARFGGSETYVSTLKRLSGCECHAEERTGLFDTHPTDRDRIASAAREGAAGVFRGSGPASALFRDFEALVRREQAAEATPTPAPSWRPSPRA